MKEHHVARTLGWFSIGLGLAELIAPRKISRIIGVREHGTLLRLLGAREVASGLGLLGDTRRSGWMWSRVMGDVMDLALLGVALTSKTSARSRVCAAATAVVGVAALDLVYSKKSTDRERVRVGTSPRGGRVVNRSITVNKSPAEVYLYWRNFENLPQFMSHLKSVQVVNEKESEWVAKGPAGKDVSWRAELVEDRPNELIAWRSLPGSEIETTGTVRFEPATGGRGTILRVNLEYKPPGGTLGGALAKLMGQAPEKQIPVDLLRFRQLMETGEISRTEGQSAGRKRSTTLHDDLIRA